MNPVSTASSMRTLLNPNAREFVPISLKASLSAIVTPTRDEAEPSTASDNGKAFSDKTLSSDTCASDEESRKYWNAQLPDDIFAPDTDFFLPAIEDSIERGSMMSASKSSAMKDSIEDVADDLLRERPEKNGMRQPARAHFPAHGYTTGYNIPLSSIPFSGRIGNWNSQLSGGGNGSLHSSAFLQTALKESSTMGALNILCNEFPDVLELTLAEVYQANGGDLGLTIRMLHQLKVQGEASLWNSMASPSCFPQNSRPLGFSASSTPDVASRGSHFLDDFDGQPAGELSLEPSSFSSMNSHPNLHNEELSDDRSDVSLSRHKHWISSRSWVGTDDTLEIRLSELREEAQKHGRIRNVYFEQGRQAFYVGNRMLAKEASAKEQLHNRLMKAAQTKAAEIELQRSMYNSQLSSFGPGQTQLLDLRGLHVNEAIQILKKNLAALRVAARSSWQRQQVFISIGTGHQKGGRTLARLVFAVKQHLVEEELLNFTETQPGILKVIVS